MGFVSKIAYRYLVGKKTTTAINLVSAITVMGLAIGTCALILILSVFNGFKEMMSGYLDQSNPDLIIAPKKGKYFSINDEQWKQLAKIDNIAFLSRVVQEHSMFEYLDNQKLGIIKGVDTFYNKVTDIDHRIEMGQWYCDNSDKAIIGIQLAVELSVNVKNFMQYITVYSPKKNNRSILGEDFTRQSLQPTGIFTFRNDKDGQYVIAGYDIVSEMLNVPGQYSFIELKLTDLTMIKSTIEQIKKVLGKNYEYKDRIQQNEAFLKIMNIEKWSSYMILGATLILIMTNMLACLWMIVIEKKVDLAILRAMGASRNAIQSIMLIIGLQISIIGYSLGLIFSFILYWLQVNYGIVSVPDGYIMSAYPVAMYGSDLILVFATVMIFGIIATLPSYFKVREIEPFVRAE